MNRNQLVFIIALIATSCNQTKNKLEYQICKDSIQYWRWDYHYFGIKYSDIFRFDKNLVAIPYWSDKAGNVRLLTNNDGSEVSYKWSVSNDSVLTMNSSKSKILKWTKDTIFIGSVKRNNRIDTLYRLDGRIKVINKGDSGDTLKRIRALAPI